MKKIIIITIIGQPCIDRQAIDPIVGRRSQRAVSFLNSVDISVVVIIIISLYLACVFSSGLCECGKSRRSHNRAYTLCEVTYVTVFPSQWLMFFQIHCCASSFVDTPVSSSLISPHFNSCRIFLCPMCLLTCPNHSSFCFNEFLFLP